MGAPVEETTVINRKKIIEESGQAVRKSSVRKNVEKIPNFWEYKNVRYNLLHLNLGIYQGMVLKPVENEDGLATRGLFKT